MSMLQMAPKNSLFPRTKPLPPAQYTVRWNNELGCLQVIEGPYAGTLVLVWDERKNRPAYAPRKNRVYIHAEYCTRAAEDCGCSA